MLQLSVVRRVAMTDLLEAVRHTPSFLRHMPPTVYLTCDFASGQRHATFLVDASPAPAPLLSSCAYVLSSTAAADEGFRHATSVLVGVPPARDAAAAEAFADAALPRALSRGGLCAPRDGLAALVLPDFDPLVGHAVAALRARLPALSIACGPLAAAFLSDGAFFEEARRALRDGGGAAALQSDAIAFAGVPAEALRVVGAEGATVAVGAARELRALCSAHTEGERDAPLFLYDPAFRAVLAGAAAGARCAFARALPEAALGSILGSTSGSASGSILGSASGSILGSTSGSILGSTSGSILGSTSGSASGSILGSTSGSILGSTSGSILGSTSGSASGSILGSASGSASGSILGSASGSILGSTSGSILGSTSGSILGSASGSASGSILGSASGSASGSALGSALGSLSEVALPVPRWVAAERSGGGALLQAFRPAQDARRAAAALRQFPDAQRVLATCYGEVPGGPDACADRLIDGAERLERLRTRLAKRLATDTVRDMQRWSNALEEKIAAEIAPAENTQGGAVSSNACREWMRDAYLARIARALAWSAATLPAEEAAGDANPSKSDGREPVKKGPTTPVGAEGTKALQGHFERHGMGPLAAVVAREEIDVAVFLAMSQKELKTVFKATFGVLKKMELLQQELRGAH